MKKMTDLQRSKIEFTDGTTRQYLVVDKRHNKRVGGITVQYELAAVPGKKNKCRVPVKKLYHWTDSDPHYLDNEQLNNILENIIRGGLQAELDHCEILSFDVGQAVIPVGKAKMSKRKDRIGQQVLISKLKAK